MFKYVNNFISAEYYHHNPVYRRPDTVTQPNSGGQQPPVVNQQHGPSGGYQIGSPNLPFGVHVPQYGYGQQPNAAQYGYNQQPGLVQPAAMGNQYVPTNFPEKDNWPQTVQPGHPPAYEDTIARPEPSAPSEPPPPYSPT